MVAACPLHNNKHNIDTRYCTSDIRQKYDGNLLGAGWKNRPSGFSDLLGEPLKFSLFPCKIKKIPPVNTVKFQLVGINLLVPQALLDLMMEKMRGSAQTIQSNNSLFI